jgi:hypothetical protein
MKTTQLKEKIITECPSWSVEYMNEMLNKLISQAEEQGFKRGVKKGRQAGIYSTYPVTNLDDESKNCKECFHDHGLADKKNCRCDCCVSGLTQKSTKQKSTMD